MNVLCVSVLGEYYWKLADTEVMPGYPRRISEGWGGLPSNLDAALSWPDGKIYFFKVKGEGKLCKKDISSLCYRDLITGDGGTMLSIQVIRNKFEKVSLEYQTTWTPLLFGEEMIKHTL